MRPVSSVLVCLLIGFPLGSHGHDVTGARLQVSATVLPHVSLESNEAPVRISAADVTRGYVDVTRRFALRTNVPGRVVLHFQPRIGYTQAVAVDGFGATLHVPEPGLDVVPTATRELHLSFRFRLADGLAPGEYPWPLHVTARVR